jgi:hypothetical protein
LHRLIAVSRECRQASMEGVCTKIGHGRGASLSIIVYFDYLLAWYSFCHKTVLKCRGC